MRLVRRLDFGLGLRLVLASAIWALAGPASAQVAVAITKPSAAGTWPAMVSVDVNVVSTYALASVTARVDDRAVALVGMSVGRWQGTLDLTGLAPGSDLHR